MEINIMLVDVGASLADPYFLAGFMVASLVSSSFAVGGVIAWSRRQSVGRILPLVWFALLGLSLFATPAVMHFATTAALDLFGGGLRVHYWGTQQYVYGSWVFTAWAMVTAIVHVRRAAQPTLSLFARPNGRT